MENLKIRVNSANESREVQELFFELGYKWNHHKGHYDIKNYPNIIRSHETGEMTQSILSESLYKGNKEITLPELRAMANPMKEYLMPSRNYKYILTDAREALEPHAEDWIAIPEGAIRARFYPHDPDGLEFENSTLQWWGDKNNKWINYENYSNTLEHSRVVWQRDQDQDEPFLTPECTLNDQYAEIEQVRQAEIYGTAKAKPDFNFGAAQAIGRAKMRENSHYFIDVSDVDEVDFYEIAKRYNVADPAIQHILKKCLAIGNRGHKDLETDLKDILKTAKRALQINGFGE